MKAAQPVSVYRFWLVDQLLVPIVLNFAIGWCLAWVFYRNTPVVPLWGAESASSDILGTSVVLPWVNCMINSAVLKKHSRQGRVPRVSVDLIRWPWRLAPTSPVWRGLVLALLCVIFVALPTLAILDFSGLEHFELRTCLGLIASYAALLAALTSPVIALIAAARASRGSTG